MPLRMSVAHATLYEHTSTRSFYFTLKLRLFLVAFLCLSLVHMLFFSLPNLSLTRWTHLLGVVCSGVCFFFFISTQPNDGLYCPHKLWAYERQSKSAIFSIYFMKSYTIYKWKIVFALNRTHTHIHNSHQRPIDIHHEMLMWMEIYITFRFNFMNFNFALIFKCFN